MRVTRPPTQFQRKVYAVVKTIPTGETRSYLWVAIKVGNPKAARAVGGALHANPTLGIIPCHRVIRADGSLGGFSRGVARKKQLLHRERNG